MKQATTIVAALAAMARAIDLQNTTMIDLQENSDCGEAGWVSSTCYWGDLICDDIFQQTYQQKEEKFVLLWEGGWKTHEEYCSDCTTNEAMFIDDTCAGLMAEEHTCRGFTGRYHSYDDDETIINMTYQEYCDAHWGCCWEHF